MRGILLAGGRGSRLYPLTRVVNKHLLPIHDKPMLFYSFSVLMLAGIREVLIVSSPRDLDSIRTLMGTGEALGMSIDYAAQVRPGGVAQGLLVGASFLQGGPCALALGDNFFYGPGLGQQLRLHTNGTKATVFAFEVDNPQSYGVVNMDETGAPRSFEEKPTNPRSRLAVPGLYFYPEDVVELAKVVRPSDRGELEISAINDAYLQQGRLSVDVLPRGTVWLDTGVLEHLRDASEFTRMIEQRTGSKVACLEEIAWRNGWISDEALTQLADNGDYGLSSRYLRRLLEGAPPLAARALSSAQPNRERA